MQKKVKRAIIISSISIVIMTVVLVLLGLATVDLNQNALNYNTITANYSDAVLYGPGLYWIGIANKFLKFNKNQQTFRFSGLSAFSSDFYKVTANMQVTLQFNLSSSNSFETASNFLLLFGENPMEIIQPLIKNQMLVVLSSQASSFYQSSTQPNSLLENTTSSRIASALLQWVPTNVNVIVESLICQGSTSNTEIIDRQIDSLIHDLQRTTEEKVELTNYFSNTYANKLKDINSAYNSLNIKAQQLQRIYKIYGANTTGLNISQILYDNKPLQYNLNLVDILEQLATIANRTFPY